MQLGKPTRRNIIVGGAALGATLAMPGIVRAQSWPSRPITILCGFSAGGTTDALARLLANVLSSRLGQPVVVENRTGAAGALAMAATAAAEPDGHTLLFSAVGQLTVVPHVSTNLDIDPRSDLAHISLLAEGDFLLNAGSNAGFNTIEDLIAAAKERPGQVLYGTSGAGGNLHLFTEAFLLAAGVKSRGVHYSGGSTMMPDLLNDQVQFALSSYPVSAPYIETEQLKPLLIVGKQRNEHLPDVPTGADIGFELLRDCMDWFGLHAPAGTPTEIIDALAVAVKESTADLEMSARLTTGSLRPVGNTPSEFEARIRADYDLFGKIAADAGIKAS